MKKLNYRFRTLNDPLARKTLEGINSLEDKQESRGLYMIVGGFAVQSYLAEQQRRPTADVDVLIGKPLTNSEFKEFSKPIIEFFMDSGYNAHTHKGQATYYIDIQSKSEDEGKLLIDFSRRGANKYGRDKKRIKRELEHSKIKQLEKGIIYKVCSPEDIVLTKLVRITNGIKRGRDYKMKDAKAMQRYLNELREDAICHLGDENIAMNLRINSDIYDILCLYPRVGLNEEYFIKGKKEWNSLKEDFPGKEKFSKFLLPGIKI